MSECNTNTSRELQALNNFVQEWQLEDGSYLQTKITTLVVEYLKGSKVKVDKRFQLATISVKLKDAHSIVVNLNTTVVGLKRRLECLGRHPIAYLTVDRTNQSLATSLHRTLADCGIVDGDIIVADFTFEPQKGLLERTAASGLIANSSFQYLVLLIHAFMQDEGYQAVISIKNAKDGFHPLYKRMHEEEFLRPNWNADPCSIQLYYEIGGLWEVSILQLSCEDLAGTVLLSLSAHGEKSRCRYIELPVYKYIEERRNSARQLEFVVQNGKDLRWQLMSLVHAVVRHVTSHPPFGRIVRLVHPDGWTSSSRRGPCPLVAPPGREPTEEEIAEREEYEKSVEIMMEVINEHKNKPYFSKYTPPPVPVPPSQLPASPPRSARSTALFSSLAGIAAKAEKIREPSRSPSRSRASSPRRTSSGASEPVPPPPKQKVTFAGANAEVTEEKGAQAQREQDGPEENTITPAAKSPPRRRAQQSSTRLRVPWVQALRDMIRSKTKTSGD